jgi:hypothetical protein
MDHREKTDARKRRGAKGRELERVHFTNFLVRRMTL